MYEESNMKTYMTMCKIDGQRELGNSNRGSVST